MADQKLLTIDYKLFRLNVTLTLSPPILTSLDPDETQSNSASHPDTSCLTHRQHFNKF